MSDYIVERLRAEATDNRRYEVNGTLAVEAADLITTLRAENERLRAALKAWNNAVRVHVMMEKPVFIGVSPTLGRLAWEKARAALEEKP